MTAILNNYDRYHLRRGYGVDLKVKKGNNCLPTCFQFDGYDEDSDKLFTVKIYDKIMDLISRDGS